MADQHKENLRKLLDFLEAEIIHKPENRWFVDELYNRLPHKPTPHSEDYSKIEKYLGLDYRLDSAQPIFDYSFISNEYLRNCFTADCREMLRYRYGTRAHGIDFPEFCRYALLQAERALNLYLQKLGNLPTIISHIKTHNTKAKGLDEAKSLDSISFAVKLWAFCSEFGLLPVFNILDRVREVRNQQSHGGANSECNDEFFHRHNLYLINNGYPLLSNGWVNWEGLKESNSELFQKYEKEVHYTFAHKRYISLAWQRQLPFEEVVAALELMIIVVSRNVNF